MIFSNIFYELVSGYEMKQLTIQTKLSAMRVEFRQIVVWIDKIPLEKWTRDYDDEKIYMHMTTNLAKCMNTILKGVRSLPIWDFVKRTFKRTNAWFVKWRSKAKTVLRACHHFLEDIVVWLKKMSNNLTI